MGKRAEAQGKGTKMYERKWKDAIGTDWEEISDEEARKFAARHYRDADAALSSVRDGCDMNTPFAWIRWAADEATP